MESFSMLLVLCEGNSPVTGGFPSRRASDAEFWSLYEKIAEPTAKMQVN